MQHNHYRCLTLDVIFIYKSFKKNGIRMTTKSDQESNPQKTSNDDKGNQDSYKNTEPNKKPNEQPENPMKEQK